MQQLQGPTYRVVYLQTKPNELKPFIFSECENGNCICYNGQNLSYWNRYFVMYPHKYTLKNWRKSTRKSGRMIDMIVKNTRASRVLRWVLDPGQYYIACFAHSTLLHYIGKILETISGPPPFTKSWIHYWLLTAYIVWDSPHLRSPGPARGRGTPVRSSWGGR